MVIVFGLAYSIIYDVQQLNSINIDMKNVDVLLLTDINAEVSMKPMGAYSIAGLLRSHGFNVLVIDMVSNFTLPELEGIIDKVVSDSTLFIGYSMSFYYFQNKTSWIEYENIRRLNEFVKNKNNNIKSIVGGAQTKDFEKALKSSQENYGIDYIMHGYSEAMILEFTNSLRNKTTVKFSYKENNIKVINYDYTGSMHDFRNHTHVWDKNDIVRNKEPLTLEVARGCVFKCKFCTFPLIGKKKNDDSYIKTEEALLTEVLDNYEKFNTVTYAVIDDTFNERTDKLELLLRVRDKSKLDLGFTGYNRLDLINRKPEQIPLFKDLNWQGFIFGIESMNVKASQAVGKGDQPLITRDTLEKIKAKFNDRILIQTNFIIGLPYDTPETVDNWMNKVMEKDFPSDFVNVMPLSLVDGMDPSYFFKNIKDYGYETFMEGNFLKWKNEFWDSTQVRIIAENYREVIRRDPKTRTPGFNIPAVMKYNIDYDTLVTTPVSEILKMIKELNMKQEYFNWYRSELIKLVTQ
jgi:radical SAM superfamily enzyme YgiQ (UPF0313 family)